MSFPVSSRDSSRKYTFRFGSVLIERHKDGYRKLFMLLFPWGRHFLWELHCVRLQKDSPP